MKSKNSGTTDGKFSISSGEPRFPRSPPPALREEKIRTIFNPGSRWMKLSILPTELKSLKLKLEKEGEEKTTALIKSCSPNNFNAILEGSKNIIKEGEKEFVEKTGRYLTYSEIREIYG